jgi:hypothetical protein
MGRILKTMPNFGKDMLPFFESTYQNMLLPKHVLEGTVAKDDK